MIGTPFDELHDEVGTTFVGDAAVLEMGDVGVGQARQDLPLGEEPRPQLRRVHVSMEQLEGDLLVEGAIHPLGPVHGAHAAVADGLEGAVRADCVLRPGGAGDLERGGGGDLLRQVVEVPGCRVVETQELLGLAQQRLVVRAGLAHERGPIVEGEREGVGEELLQPIEPFVAHGADLAIRSVRSGARGTATSGPGSSRA